MSKSGISEKFDHLIKERAFELEVPIFEPLPNGVKASQNVNPFIGVCGQCGMPIRRVSRTECIHPRCPTPIAKRESKDGK